MSDQESLRSLLREAELYQTQGLLSESLEIYQEVIKFLEKHAPRSHQERLVSAVKKRIESIQKDLVKFNNPNQNPKLSEDIANLIRKLFSFSETPEAAAMEAAVALAKFGQHEQALVEFHRLLGKGFAPVVVAKHILECHFALSSPDAAVAQLEQWTSRSLLGQEDLAEVRNFLEDMLEARGLKNKLPKPDQELNKKKKVNGEKKIALDVYLVKIQLDNASIDLKEVGLDVSFQTKDTISVVVPANQRKLLDYLKLGMTLPKMKFYTTAAVFNGKGVISGKTMIKIGPKQGDYVLDIKIQDV